MQNVPTISIQHSLYLVHHTNETRVSLLVCGSEVQNEKLKLICLIPFKLKF